jgi:catechol 2,3-dioxygenase-like lactoylglutathione lyase family enzyme
MSMSGYAFDHIAVIVDDIDTTRAALEQAFGFQEEAVFEIESMSALFLTAGGLRVELLQLHEQEARRKRLGDGGSARIEHIAFAVDDIDAAYEAVRAVGLEPLGPPRDVEGFYRTFMVKPQSAGGVQYQVVQRYD